MHKISQDKFDAVPQLTLIRSMISSKNSSSDVLARTMPDDSSVVILFHA